MTRDELIETARNLLADGEELADHIGWRMIAQDVPALAAVEVIANNGFADDEGGDVDVLGHLVRVDRWIMRTDSQGFAYLHTHATEDEAQAELDEFLRTSGLA